MNAIVSPDPIPTPWGRADYMDTVAEGIVRYGTPSHGGFHLSPERLAKIDPRARAYAAKWSKGWGDAWFEEDCAGYAVVEAFPQYFPPHAVETAWRVAQQYWR